MKKFYTLILIAFMGIGQVFAQLPYNTTLTQSHYNNSSVVIQKEGTQSWDGGVRLGTSSGWSPGNWNEKYIVIALDQQSIAYQLSFKCRITTTMATRPDWYVEESADNSTWSRVWTASAATTSIITVSTDWATPDPIGLSKSTKYVKICYSGNYSGIVADIKVSDQAYVNNPKVGDDEITSLDFGANTISSGVEEKTFDVEWCNVNAMTVTSDNALFTVSPASFGGKAQYGTQTITVGYNRNQEIGAHNATITITNGSVTKTVTVSGSTTKREQAIHWNADLAATNFTMNSGDELTGAALATADNTEAEITYESDNTDVIAVSEDGKTLYAGENGTATITITATGNDIYNEKVESQVFSVTSDNKQVIVWDQNFMGLKTDANPNTIELTATATSGGEVTYALEEGSDNCVTLNGNVLTITGTPGVAYIIATQAGGEINGEVWIAATARKQIKVRDPQSACDEYALADESFSFAKGDKNGMVYQEFSLAGKPTNLTFKAKRGDLKYFWETQDDLYIEQYALGEAGMDWKLVAAIQPGTSVSDFGPYALDATATKIRFRTGEYAEQTVTNISIPRKKEMIVSESAIEESAERNVRWAKTISVSRSNVDVVDITVSENCPFSVSKTSIGTDCADRGTETFEVFFTPAVKDSVYTGTITITDGKANPTTHTINLAVTCTGYNQSINGFVLPESCQTMDTVVVLPATATSELDVVYLSSDSTKAYVENDTLRILSAGTVDIIAYQAGDERYNEVSVAKTIVIELTPVMVSIAPTASEVAIGAPVGMAWLFGGEAEVDGTFSWLNPDQIMNEEGEVDVAVLFTPDQNNIYTTATVDILVTVTAQPRTYGEYTAEVCEGDSIEFAGVWYNDAVQDSLHITLPDTTNMYGGDSIVILTFIVHPKEVETSEETIRQTETLKVVPNEWSILFEDGQETLWDGEEIVFDEPGELTLVKYETTEFGCEKKIIRHIVITSTTDFEQVKADVEAEKFFHNGTLYIRRGEMIYTISGERVK